MIASFDIGEKNFAYAIGDMDRLVKWRHVDVTTTTDDGGKRRRAMTVADSCEAISRCLEEESETLSTCSKCIVEQQMRANVRAQRLSQHVWTWLRLTYPRTEPEFVQPSTKTRHFCAGPSVTGKGRRKRWAVERVTDLLTERADWKNLDYMNSLPKKDDVADSYLQLVAFDAKRRRRCGGTPRLQ